MNRAARRRMRTNFPIAAISASILAGAPNGAIGDSRGDGGLVKLKQGGQRTLWIHPDLGVAAAAAARHALRNESPASVRDMTFRLRDEGIEAVSLDRVIGCFPAGRVPAALLAISREPGGLPAVGDGRLTAEVRSAETARDVALENVSIDQACMAISEAYGIVVAVSEELRQSRTPVSIVGQGMRLKDAVQLLAEQIGARYAWRAGRVELTSAESPGGVRVDAADVEKEDGESLPRQRAWTLDDAEPTWREFADLARFRARMAVVFPEGWSGRRMKRMAAEGDAADVVIARGMWDSPPIEVRPVRVGEARATDGP